MVIAGIENTLTTFVAVSATLAAVMGIIGLERFFHDKLKDLFSDKHYFIFFFLTMGYIFYSLGEVSLYLTSVVLESESFPGISDLYWVGGGILIFISFLALAWQLLRSNPGKVMVFCFSSLIIVAVVVIILFAVTLGPDQHFLYYFYPIMSSLIVSCGLSTLFFFSQLGAFRMSLTLFFIGSSLILIGDVFYTSVLASQGYGLPGLIADLAYLAGYFTSFVAFLALRFNFRSLLRDGERYSVK